MSWTAIIKEIFKSFQNNASTDKIITPQPVAAPVNVIVTTLTYNIANLAEKYETGKKDPGFISNGSKWGDPGGDSYGSYQIETKKGTMQAYLKTKDGFTSELIKYKMNSPEFKDCWKRLAKEDPEGFQQSQFEFLCRKPGGYNDAIAYAKKLGWAADNFALRSAIFSTSNQSGGWKNGIFNKAGIKPTDNIKTQIHKLYDARAAYFISLSSLPEKVKANIVRARTEDERRDCLALL